jgi:hypothetical protein
VLEALGELRTLHKRAEASVRSSSEALAGNDLLCCLLLHMCARKRFLRGRGRLEEVGGGGGKGGRVFERDTLAKAERREKRGRGREGESKRMVGRRGIKRGGELHKGGPSGLASLSVPMEFQS